MWWEEEINLQSITVFDDPPEKTSLVLDARGNPYIVKRQIKMGFDLSPKKDKTNG